MLRIKENMFTGAGMVEVLYWQGCQHRQCKSPQELKSAAAELISTAYGTSQSQNTSTCHKY